MCDGVWSAVCRTYFDNSDALVACRQLGFSTGVAFTEFSRFGTIIPDEVWRRSYLVTSSQTTRNHVCYTEKASPTRHRPERQHNARSNQEHMCDTVQIPLRHCKFACAHNKALCLPCHACTLSSARLFHLPRVPCALCAALVLLVVLAPYTTGRLENQCCTQGKQHTGQMRCVTGGCVYRLLGIGGCRVSSPCGILPHVLLLCQIQFIFFLMYDSSVV